MTVDQREFITQMALGSFLMEWSKLLMGNKGCTVVDTFYVWNELDRFCIDCARAKLTSQDAVTAWGKHDVSTKDFPELIRDSGNCLFELVKEHRLSYGDVWTILVNARASDHQRILSNERAVAKH